MRAVAKLAFAVIVGTGAALYSRESPAPPPPILNCTSGAPAALVFESPSTALGGSINSAMGGSVLVQAVDASGNPLRDVPITFTAPATGPSAGFALFTDASHYTLSPQVTVNTRSDCHGIGPPAIANGLVGGYQIAASTPSVAQPLLLPAANTAPATPSELVAQGFSTQRVSPVGLTLSAPPAAGPAPP